MDLGLLLLSLTYLIAATRVLCDEYFIPSLRFLGNALRLSPDMEGATLMAMGSSTPELLTSLIAVYLYGDDVDLNPAPSTIVGSSMFNMTFVIGSFVIVSQRYHPLRPQSVLPALNSFALHRDVSAYIVSVTVLYVFYDVLSPNQMSGAEGLCLILLWVLYVVVLLNSNRCGPSAETMVIEADYGGDDVVILEVEDDHRPQNVRRRGTAILGDFLSTFYSNPMQKLFAVLVPIKVPRVTDDSDFTVFPMPRLESVADSEFTRCFMVFCLSVLWLSAITYLLLSAVSALGDCLNVSASTMGITLIAVGSSLPDTMSSIVLAQRYGQSMMGMVVSNCCSSNVFNICFVNGTTFSLKYAMRSAQTVAANVDTENAAGLMMVQIFSALLFLLLMHCNGMRLSECHGGVLVAMYAVFVLLFVVF